MHKTIDVSPSLIHQLGVAFDAPNIPLEENSGSSLRNLRIPGS